MSLPPPVSASLLLTDLYQLTMLQAYLDQGQAELAVFEFFVRRLPEQRQFLMAAGLEQVLDFLEGACLSEAELAWLAGTGRFHGRFIESLRLLRQMAVGMPAGSSGATRGRTRIGCITP